jgi:hypothetical protein
MSICRLPLKATPLKVVPDGVHGPPPPPELELATTEELLLELSVGALTSIAQVAVWPAQVLAASVLPTVISKFPAVVGMRLVHVVLEPLSEEACKAVPSQVTVKALIGISVPTVPTVPVLAKEQANWLETALSLLEDSPASVVCDELLPLLLLVALEEDETEGELAPPSLEEDSAPEGLLLTSPFAELLLSSPASSLPLLSEEQEKINAMASETHAVNRKRVFFIICLFWFSL